MAEAKNRTVSPEARRPLSPHLQIYRPMLTMMMSIMHRITGVALYAGTLLLAWWLIAASTDARAFATANSVLTSIPGQIVLLGFTVWAHHMFVSGMSDWIRIPMMITTAIIAIPTGIKIFSWIATLWRGVLKMDTPMLWATGFIAMFTLGGISGVMLAMVPLDIHVSDTYFIVAHIHYVLFGGSLFTIYAGIYFWFPKMTGRMFNEKLGKLHFWLTFIFFNITFAPMHLIGVQGMPRRVSNRNESRDAERTMRSSVAAR